jgi:xylulokinase
LLSVALLAIDVGTSGPKAILYSADGHPLSVASIEFNVSRDAEGHAELDTEVLWTAVRDVILRVTVDSPAHTVKAVSISSHGESFISLDRSGQPLGPFILNIDSRGASEAEELAQLVGRERLFEITGLPCHSMYTLPKIMWLRNNRPDVFSRAAKFLCVEDYLLHRAGLGAFISLSLASRTFALDLRHNNWSEEILRAAQLSPSHFAELTPSGTPLGMADPHITRELNISSSALWIAGGHDQGCCSLGGGGLTDGVAVDGTGTFECMSIAGGMSSISTATLSANHSCERHVAAGMFLTLAFVPGGVVPRWMRDHLLAPIAGRTGGTSYHSMIESAHDAPTGLFFLPHLVGTGTPWLDDQARGVIAGITANTTLDMLVRSGLEGVTYEMKWNIDLLEEAGWPINVIHAVGGGSKSNAWLQIKADIFGRTVVAIDAEASCAGAAICAGIGNGTYSSWEQGAKEFAQITETVSPRPAVHARYRELFEQYKELANRVYGFHQFPIQKESVIREGACTKLR